MGDRRGSGAGPPPGRQLAGHTDRLGRLSQDILELARAGGERRRPVFLDVAMVLAPVGILGSVAYARYIQRTVRR